MPQLIDKLLLNQGGLRSFWRIIQGWFAGILIVMEGSQELAEEIHAHNWQQEPEAQVFLRRQEAICASADTACGKLQNSLKKCHVDQMALAEDMRVWIDKKLAEQSPSQPKP